MDWEISELKTPPLLSAAAKKCFQEAIDSGFTHIGWLKISFLVDLSAAAFVNPDGSISLSIVGQDNTKKFEVLAIDLVSHLNDSRKLTSSNSGIAASLPEEGIFKFNHPNEKVPQLLKYHHEHLQDLGGHVASYIKSLSEFAASIREFLELERNAQTRRAEKAHAIANEEIKKERAERLKNISLDDEYYLIHEAGTWAGNYDLSTEDIIKQLKKWKKKCRFKIAEADDSTVRIKFETLPEDLDAFVREVYDFCPDIVDQGTGCALDMMEVIAELGGTVDASAKAKLEKLNEEFEEEDFGVQVLKGGILESRELTLWWD